MAGHDSNHRPREPVLGSQAERAILESLPLGLYVLDQAWRFLYLNPIAERFFQQVAGCTREQLLGKSIWEACPEVADSTFSQEYNQAASEQRAFRLECYYPALGRWFAVQAPPSPDFHAFFFQDVTERVQMERALRQRIDELADVDRGRDEFLVHLAHEVRNVLAPVRNAVHLLGRTAEPETVTQARSLAEEEIQFLGRLLDDLLKVAELTAGKTRLRKERVDLAAAVSRALASALVSVEARGHRFTIDLPPDPLWVEADPHHIELILAHLLSNAGRFTKPGGQIWVSATRQERSVVLRVRDSGIGIAKEALPGVFHLFMRGGRPGDRTQRGVGVGLTLVWKLVGLYGGTVEANSDGFGRGSEFIVRLPISLQRSGEESAPEAGATGYAGVPLRVLVVDDSAEVAQSTALLVGSWGHEAHVAYDGAAALEEARTWCPEVVLLDLGMPEIDGYEVATRLRALANTPEPVLVALTGYGEEDDRQHAREAGFEYHMVKPVSPNDLRDMLLLAGSLVRQRPGASPE